MIEVGDHVTVGGAGNTHWVVEDINTRGTVQLRSGVTGVHRREWLDELILFKKGNV